MADNLFEAQRLADGGTNEHRAMALALIDIAYSLRDINDELRRTRLGQHH